jgi:hypothetical protein
VEAHRARVEWSNTFPDWMETSDAFQGAPHDCRSRQVSLRVRCARYISVDRCGSLLCSVSVSQSACKPACRVARSCAHMPGASRLEPVLLEPLLGSNRSLRRRPVQVSAS